jgi:thiamine-monophosphate kinase
MRLKDLGERRIITEIRRRLSGRGATGVRLGMGDDAAVIRGPKKNLLLTKDLLVEDFDFRKALCPPRLLGRKSLNVNLSDIAAMGGRPLHAILGLALPGDTEEKWLSEFLEGFREASRERGVVLVGGDVSQARTIMISVTVTGEAGPFVPRSGAKPGDLVFVSGTLGDAAAGLRLLEKGCRLGKERAVDSLLKAFLDPEPRLELGSLLARRKLASAMIDVSDGLSVDLAHLCDESGVGAEVELGRIPLSGALRRFRKNPLPLAINGGEDFELLFTVRPRNVPRLKRLGPRFKVTAIGRITAGKRIVTVDSAGRKRPLAIRGYEHFR